MFSAIKRRRPQHAPAGPIDTPPAMVSLIKTAKVSLTKSGLAEQRAAVYLVLDHSGSMRSHYASGAVQRLAEQALALSVNLDDDGVVPLVYFGSGAEAAIDVRLDNYAGIINHTHPKVVWGSTSYTAAIEAVIEEHQESGSTHPGLVIFQTDGNPDSRAAAANAICDAAKLPLHWAFIGFGSSVSFLRELDTIPGRVVDNASFFHATHPSRVTDAELYDGITAGFAPWLSAARAAGIIR